MVKYYFSNNEHTLIIILVFFAIVLREAAVKQKIIKVDKFIRFMNIYIFKKMKKIVIFNLV